MKKVLSNLLAAVLVVTMIPIMAIQAQAAKEASRLIVDNSALGDNGGKPYVSTVAVKGYTVTEGGKEVFKMDSKAGSLVITFSEVMKADGAGSVKLQKVGANDKVLADTNRIGAATGFGWATNEGKTVLTVPYTGLDQSAKYRLSVTGFNANKMGEVEVEVESDDQEGEDDEEQGSTVKATTKKAVERPIGDATTNVTSYNYEQIEIVTAPGNKNVKVGETLSFNVEASEISGVQFTYAWYKKVNGGNQLVSSQKSWSKTAELNDGGNYFVEVSGVGAYSDTAEFTVSVAAAEEPKFEFTAEPKDVAAKQGDTVKFEAKVKDITGVTPTYSWYKYGDSKTVLGTGPTYTINNVSDTHKGEYYVVVTGKGAKENTSRFAKLTVNAKSSITISDKTPAAQDVTEGQPATFTVNAKGTGTGALQYQWYESVNGQKDKAVGTNSNTYKIDKTNAKQDGNMYYCVVTDEKNKNVTATSVKASLKVRAAASLATPKLKSAVTTGRNTALVEWEPVKDAKEYRIYYSKNSTAGTKDPYVTVSSSVKKAEIAKLDQTTTYYFRVTAVSGSVESKASNIVNAKTWLTDQIVEVFPVHGDNKVDVKSTVSVKFGKEINRVGNSGIIIWKGNTKLSDVSWSVDSKDKTKLIISHPTFGHDTEYTVEVAKETVSLAGNQYNSSYSFTFITQTSRGNAGTGKDTDNLTPISSGKVKYDNGRFTITDDSVTALDVQNVYVDGKKLVEGTDYTVRSGSVIIEFKQSLLDKLATGKHDVTVEFSNYVAERTIEVKKTGSGGTGGSGNNNNNNNNSNNNNNNSSSGNNSGSGNQPTPGGNTGGGNSGNNFNPSTGR